MNPIDIARDKIEMAWRHKSRGEKNLLKVIAFLVFALVCFIIAVTAMDLAFKAKIRSLEDEIHDLKTESPETTLFTTTNEPDTTVTVSTTTPDSTTTITNPSTSTETGTTEIPSTTDSESTTAEPANAIFDALRAMFLNFSGMTSSTKSLEKITHRGSITSRSRGTFFIMADINHEESNSITPDPPLVYIDNNGTSSSLPNDDNGTAIVELSSHFDDTEEDFETTADVADDLELLVNGEGSGTGADEEIVPT